MEPRRFQHYRGVPEGGKLWAGLLDEGLRFLSQNNPLIQEVLHVWQLLYNRSKASMPVIKSICPSCSNLKESLGVG
jgi:hypothetical protein